MKHLFLIAALGSGLWANAQLDTIGQWRFGLTPIITINSITGNANTSAAVGGGLGGYAHFEPDECHNYYLSLTLSGNPILYTPPAYQFKYPVYRRYINAIAERGTHIVPLVRLQYGVHLSYLLKVGADYGNWDEMNRMDAGVNVGIWYYTTEQISFGVRYLQGLINVKDNYPGERNLYGLNGRLFVTFNFRLFK